MEMTSAACGVGLDSIADAAAVDCPARHSSQRLRRWEACRMKNPMPGTSRREGAPGTPILASFAPLILYIGDGCPVAVAAADTTNTGVKFQERPLQRRCLVRPSSLSRPSI
jgi:hypothetical protein